MEPTNTQLLQSVVDTLCKRVVPQVTNGEVVRLIRLAACAVDEVLRRGDPSREALDIARLCTLLERGESLVRERQLGVAESVWPDRPDVLKPRGSAEQRREAILQRLTALTAAVLSNCRAQGLDPASKDFLTDVARADAAGKLRPPPLDSANEQEIPALNKVYDLSKYFSARLGLKQGAEIQAVRRLAGGFSNETLLVTVGASTESKDIVVRLARENSINSPFALTLSEEWPLLQFLAASRVPVPAPLWLEEDRSLLGSPFLVVSYVPAKPLGNSLQAAEAPSETLLTNFAAALATLHNAPWQDWVGVLSPRLAPRADLTVTESIDLVLERIRDYLSASWIDPSPLILVLFDWLERHRPNCDEAPILTHGDLGFHNWLFVGDKPMALLDWETAALCSHTKDLATVRDVVVPPAQWPFFLEAYIAAGGRAPVAEELRYYEVLRQVQALICTSIAMEKMFTNVDPLNIDYVELGVAARSYFYGAAASGIADLLS